jgi:hypothetical protein
MIQLSATMCSCIAILWASLVSFAIITLYVVVISLSTQSGNFWIDPRIFFPSESPPPSIVMMFESRQLNGVCAWGSKQGQEDDTKTNEDVNWIELTYERI